MSANNDFIFKGLKIRQAMTALIVMALQPGPQAEAGKEWDRRILFSVIPDAKKTRSEITRWFSLCLNE